MVDRTLQANGNDYNVYVPLLNSLSALGQKDDAAELRQRGIHALEQQLELVPEDVRARMLLAGYYAAAGGKEDDAVRQLQTAVALRPGDSNVLYNAACTYALLQKKAEALDTLRNAVKAGWSNMDWVSRDPDLANLHEEPEFNHLLKHGKSDG
jgi:tetratricopeptide (TPR) repeat protein